MRNRLAIALLLTTLVVALFHEAAYSYVPFFVVCSLLAYTLFLRTRYQKTDCTVHLLETTSKAPTLQIKFNKPHRFHIQGTYELLCEHAISGEQQRLTGTFQTKQQQHVIDLPVSWQHCGHMRIVEAYIALVDPLLWTKVTKTLSLTEQAILWPAYTAMPLEALSANASTAIGLDSGAKERFVPYTPGDAVQAIHWPLSAKLQTVIVQKPAFTEAKQEALALYFNDIQTVAQYDAFMNLCYSLVHEEVIEEVCVWTGAWQTFRVQEQHDIAALFTYLLQQPLAKLYAPSFPAQRYHIIRPKGEHAV